MIEKLTSDDSSEPLASPDDAAASESGALLIDASFSVPYRHRVWFCDSIFDAAGDDSDAQASPVLSQCFFRDPIDVNGSGHQENEPAKVQLWVDSDVMDYQNGLVNALTGWIETQPGLEMTRPAESIAGGECCKNDTGQIQRLLAAVNDDRLDRRSYIVVIGGGAVLDVVGYVAAIAHRGIRLIRFPSTTLAQADSGVGVKNAVNLFDKKNWQGTFAVPWAVVNDYSLLETLPRGTFVSGFSEAVKVALLKSPESFDYLCRHADSIGRRQKSVAALAIKNSAAQHLQHITDGGDPFELLEARPLDFGHWSAHKIETISDYSVSHGDAVSIGLAVDVLYSVRELGFPQTDADRVIDCLRSMGLPVWNSILISHQDELMQGLEEFRQHLGGQLTVTMLSAVGRPINIHAIDHSAMAAAIETLRQRFSNP